MRKLIIVVGACCGMFVGVASAGPVASPRAEFRLPAEVSMGEDRLPGGVLLAWDGGRVVTNVVGYADLATRRRMRADDCFWVASNTKAIACALVLTYVDEGKIGLDDPVEKYIPSWKGIEVVVRDKAGRVVSRAAPKTRPTVRQLMGHRAGLGFYPETYPGGKSISPDYPITSYSVAQLAEIAVREGLCYEPDTRRTYSNWGIDVAAAICEVVGGEGWDALLARRVLGPLGMGETFFFPTDAQMKRLATSYRLFDDKPPEATHIEQFAWPYGGPKAHPEAGGGLFSTAGDLLRFFRMLASGGLRPDGTRFLSRETMEEWYGVSPYYRSHPESAKYTFGTYADAAKGTLRHGGAYRTDAQANWRLGTAFAWCTQQANDSKLSLRRDGVWEAAVGDLLTARAAHEIGIVSEKGTSAIVVDGEKLPPMTAAFNMLPVDKMDKPFGTAPEDIAYYANLRKAGIRVFFLCVTTRWNSPTVKGKGVEDGIARAKTGLRTMLAAAPDAYIILRLNLNPPRSWVNAHPEEMVTFSDGRPRPPWAGACYCYPDGRMDGMYSLCSDAWRARGAEAMEEFFAELSKEPGFDRVIGTFLGAGGTEEWYYPQVLHQADGAYGDFSAPFRREYGRYLREKYGTEANLRAAWRRPDATFDNPPVPTPAEKAFYFDATEMIRLGLEYREGSFAAKLPQFDRDARGPYNIGTFLNLDTAQHVADYFAAWHWGTARSIVHFAKVAKRLQPQLLVGAFYGSLGQTNYLEGGTAAGTRHILDSGVVDFLAAPGVYRNRWPGGSVAMREAQDSFRIRNKVFFDETDLQTHVTGTPWQKLTRPSGWSVDTPQDTEDTEKREFARVLSTGVQGWWFDWTHPSPRWFDAPSIFALFARQQEVAREAYARGCAKASEIAVVLDPASSLLVSRLHSRTVLDYWRSTDLPRIGAPFDCYLLDDLGHANMPDYRLYVMANAYSLTERQRSMVWSKLRRNGATVLWMYASGYADPGAERRMSADNVAKTVGMAVDIVDKTIFPQFRVMDTAHPLTRGTFRSRNYGNLGRPVEDGISTRLEPMRFVNPGFFASDPAATVLGRYADGRVALALREVDGVKSVWCGAPVVQADLLRSVAAGAGCHIYSDSDDVLYATADYVTLHADGNGRRTVRFPRTCTPVEVYENRAYGRGVKSIEVDMRHGETRTWRLD